MTALSAHHGAVGLTWRQDGELVGMQAVPGLIRGDQGRFCQRELDRDAVAWFLDHDVRHFGIALVIDIVQRNAVEVDGMVPEIHCLRADTGEVKNMRRDDPAHVAMDFGGVPDRQVRAAQLPAQCGIRFNQFLELLHHRYLRHAAPSGPRPSHPGDTPWFS